MQYIYTSTYNSNSTLRQSFKSQSKEYNYVSINTSSDASNSEFYLSQDMAGGGGGGGGGGKQQYFFSELRIQCGFARGVRGYASREDI